MKILQYGKGGPRLKDALSILRTVDSLGGAVDSVARGGVKMERRIVDFAHC